MDVEQRTPEQAEDAKGAPPPPSNGFPKILFLILFLSLTIGLSVGLGIGLQDNDSSDDSSDACPDPPVPEVPPVLENPLPPTDTETTSLRHTGAEFDTLDAVYVAWPRYDYVMSLLPAQTVVLEMLTALCTCAGEDGCTSVIVQAPSDLVEAANATIIATPGLADCGITYQTSDRDDLWIRDIGPVFAKNCQEIGTSCDDMVVVDFNFDFWSAVGLGTPELNHLEATLDQQIYSQDFPEATVERTNLIGEGGNREFNGQGVLLMNRDVERYRNEKKSWSIERSEQEYKRVFGVDKIVWVDGVPNNDFIAEFPTTGKLADDDTEAPLFNWGTGGHIDELARFVKPDTIVISQISDAEVAHDTTGIVAQDQAILRSIKEQLEEATDANGEKFTVIEAPAAPLFINELTEDDELWYWFEPLNVFQERVAAGKKIHSIGATSYMNFLITNKVVLVPKYFIEGDDTFGLEEIKTADDEFMTIMSSIYPDRTVVAINPLPINQGGGGMHCISAHKNM